MLGWICRKFIKGYFGKGVLFGFFVLYAFYTHQALRASNSQEQEYRLSEGGANISNKSLQNFLRKARNKTFGLGKNTEVKPEGDWREVLGTKNELYVYSAYYDTRNPQQSLIRIIAIVKKRAVVQECYLFNEDNSTLRLPAASKPIRENWSLLYIASFITCKLPKNYSATPRSIAMVRNGVVLDPRLKVVLLSQNKHEGFMSVCVKPFHYEYNRAVWMVEFIELHILLGVDKFYFYNHTVGEDVEQLLNYYIERNIVEIFPWSLPVKTQKEIRTEGLFAALNDCNLKSVWKFNYSLMIDFDEYIIPRKHSNYRDMLKDLGDYSSYVFQNTFYYLYWNNDTEVSRLLYEAGGAGTQLYGSEAAGPYLLTLYKTQRVSTPNKYGSRSKYITKPEKAVECGNHVVWDFIDKKLVTDVSPSVALVNHYRICEYGGFNCMKTPSVIDRAAHRWLIPLMEAVAFRCSEIYPEVGKCPPAPPLGSPW